MAINFIFYEITINLKKKQLTQDYLMNSYHIVEIKQEIFKKVKINICKLLRHKEKFFELFSNYKKR